MQNGEYEVIDYTYHKDENYYVAFSGTYKECEDFIERSGSDFGYEIKLKSAMQKWDIMIGMPCQLAWLTCYHGYSVMRNGEMNETLLWNW